MPKREPLKVVHCWESEPDKAYTWEEFLPMLKERHKDAGPVKIWASEAYMAKLAKEVHNEH